MSNKILSFLRLISNSPIKTSKTYEEEVQSHNFLNVTEDEENTIPDDEGDRSDLDLPEKKKLNPDNFKNLVKSLDTLNDKETEETEDDDKDSEETTGDEGDSSSLDNIEDDQDLGDIPEEIDIDDSEEDLKEPSQEVTQEVTQEDSYYDIGTLFILFKDKNLTPRITTALTESGFLADSFTFHDQSYNTPTPSDPVYKFDVKTFLIRVKTKKDLIDMFDHLFAEIGYLLREDKISVKVEGSFTDDLIHVIEKVDK